MKLIYNNKKIEKECNDLSVAKRKYGIDIAKALHKLINILENAENLLDIYKLQSFRLHLLKGNRKDQYSLTILKSSKLRLIVYPIDENNNIMRSLDNQNLMFIKCIIIKIMEVSEHYE